MFDFLRRLFRFQPKLPPRRYCVILDESDSASYQIRVSHPGPIGPYSPYGRYSYTHLKLAEQAVSETSFELLHEEFIDGYEGGDVFSTYRAKNSRANVLAISACDLTWSDHAQQLASTHQISELEVNAVREQIEALLIRLPPGHLALRMNEVLNWNCSNRAQ